MGEKPEPVDYVLWGANVTAWLIVWGLVLFTVFQRG